MTRFRNTLNFIVVRQIKEALWHGARQQEVANHFACALSGISRIFNGFSWAEVPWPDGSKGAMSFEQRAVIQERRYKGTRVPFTPNSNSPSVHIYPTAVAQPEGLSPRLDPKLVEAEIARQEAMRDAELMKSITAPPTQKDLEDERRARLKMDTEDKPVSLDEEFWEMLLAKHSTNPLVDVAMNSTVEARIAVVEAFKNLPEEQWHSDNAQRYVKAALHMLVSAMKE